MDADPLRVLVLGGGSEIALRAVARLSSGRDVRCVLAARDAAAARARAAELGAERAVVGATTWDARDADRHDAAVAAAVEALGGLDAAICAVGSLGHASGEAGATDVWSLMTANAAGPAAALASVARAMSVRGGGSIVVLSSVAALRPRRSNYPYGAAKAAIDAFARGLADAHPSLRVQVLRPGFVRTRMTRGLAEAPFTIGPDRAARAVVRALRGRRSRTWYVPWVLRPLFAVLRALPGPLWRVVAGDR